MKKKIFGIGIYVNKKFDGLSRQIQKGGDDAQD